MLEKRDFVERLQELRTKARDIRDGTVPPPKVVSAPTPNVPTAKDVMPIDPELSDAAIEDMTLPDIKEILKFLAFAIALLWIIAKLVIVEEVESEENAEEEK